MLTDRFIRGSGVILESDGTLSNVSVNSAGNVSLQELSVKIKNTYMGITTAGKIRAAGGTIEPAKSIDNPFHAHISGLSVVQLLDLFKTIIRNPNK